MNMNWLEATNGHADEPGLLQAMPVFVGQKLVVAGGSSGMGRQTAADVVAAGGSAGRNYTTLARPCASPRLPGARAAARLLFGRARRAGPNDPGRTR